MDSQPQFNLNKFFPGLGTALPPSSPAPTSAGANGSGGGANGIHDFSASNLMVLDENQSVDCLRVNDIAKYPSPKPNRPSGTTFVTNKDLIAYAVKGGSVRVIHKESGARTLLKGHTQPIVDMTFSSGCLVTCADDELCIVWEVLIQPGGEAGITLEPRETLRLRVPAGDGAQRVLFHPFNELLMFVAHGPSVSGVRLSKTVWEAYSALDNQEDGVPLEQVASFRTVGGHSQTVNDIAFSRDGRHIVSASNDGCFIIWGLDESKDSDLFQLAKASLGQPIVFVNFVGKSIVCGFAHNEELMVVSGAPPHGVMSRVRFSAAKAGTALRLRAQSILGGRYVLLCDTNAPIMVLVQLDEAGIRRAVCLKIANAVQSFSVREVGENSVEINGVGEGMIQTFELASVQDLLPAQRPPANLTQPQPPKPTGQQAPPPQQQMPPGGMMGMLPPTMQPPKQQQPQPPMMYPPQQQQQPMPPQQMHQMPMYHPPQPTAQVSGGMPPVDLDRLLQEKMDQLLNRLEASQKAREAVERERQMRLLEVVSTTIASTVPEIVEKAIATKLTSPEFAEMLTSVVKTGLESTVSKGTIEKSLKSTLPSAMDKMTDTLQTQLTAKLQQPIARAFEEAFRLKLVPAFEAGCRNMMTQFEESFARKSLGGAIGDQGQTGPDPMERIRTAIEQQNYPQALQLALEAGDSSVLTETCEEVDLSGILVNPNHGLPQTLLLGLLSGLSSNVACAPLKRLEWIESVALALDPNSADVAGRLPAVAKQAKDALVAENQLYASLGPSATRFRAVTHILVSLGGR